MITISEFLSFTKKHSNAGVWLERGSFKLHENADDGRSPCVEMSSSMFNFLYKLQLLSENNYAGFKSWRTFPVNQSLVKKMKAKMLTAEFEVFQTSLKADLMNDKKMLQKALMIKPSYKKKTYEENLTEAKVDFSWHGGVYSRYGGSSMPKLQVGGQLFTYFSWQIDYKTIIPAMIKRLDKINQQLASAQVNDYTDLDNYARASLPFDIERKLINLGLSA